MRRKQQHRIFGFALAVLALFAVAALACGVMLHSKTPSTPESRMDEPDWTARHRKSLGSPHPGPVDLLFVGDSIIQNFEIASGPSALTYHAVWNYYYSDRHPMNLGFAGDTTANLLWRLHHGEIADISPRVAVLLIGTNNTRRIHMNWGSNEDAAAILDVVDVLHARLPATHILLLGILPSDQSGWKTDLTNQINHKLASRYSYDSIPYVTYLDITSALKRNGKLDRALFVESSKQPPQGAVHPNPRGQALMSAALEPTIAHLLDVPAKMPMPQLAKNESEETK